MYCFIFFLGGGKVTIPALVEEAIRPSSDISVLLMTLFPQNMIEDKFSWIKQLSPCFVISDTQLMLPAILLLSVLFGFSSETLEMLRDYLYGFSIYCDHFFCITFDKKSQTFFMTANCKDTLHIMPKRSLFKGEIAFLIALSENLQAKNRSV